MDKKVELDIPHETIYREIKYPRIEFKTGNLVLILPKDFKNEDTFIKKHSDWINKKNADIQSALKMVDQKQLLMDRDEKELRRMVRRTVKRFCNELNTSINKIFFRTMKTKWGSCSSNKNLTMNTLLKYLPKNLLEYVIYHELVHTIERKHTDRFWRLLKKKYEKHQMNEMELLAYWFLIQETT